MQLPSLQAHRQPHRGALWCDRDNAPLPTLPRPCRPSSSSMPRRRLKAAIAVLAAALCLCALATPAAARSPGAVSGSRIDPADPLLDGLELSLEGVAHVKRHLLQLNPPTVKYAPCNAASELTCGGTAAAAASRGELLPSMGTPEKLLPWAAG